MLLAIRPELLFDEARSLKYTDNIYIILTGSLINFYSLHSVPVLAMRVRLRMSSKIVNIKH